MCGMCAHLEKDGNALGLYACWRRVSVLCQILQQLLIDGVSPDQVVKGVDGRWHIFARGGDAMSLSDLGGCH